MKTFAIFAPLREKWEFDSDNHFRIKASNIVIPQTKVNQKELDKTCSYRYCVILPDCRKTDFVALSERRELTQKDRSQKTHPSEQTLKKDWMRSDRKLLLIALFLFPLGLRLAYLHQMGHSSPFFDVPLVDARAYADQARSIAGGEWVGKEAFWQPPLYPYFLAVLYRIFGENPYIPRLFQIVFGALSCVLVYVLGKRTFSRRVGVIAALIASLCGPLLYFEGELLPATLATLLNLLLLLSLLWAGRNPGVVRWMLPGAILGLSALTVANVLAFVPFVLVWMWIQPNTPSSESKVGFGTAGERGRRTKRLLSAGSLLLGTALVIAPVTIRNYVVSRDFVLISWNAGINFYIGNNPDYDRTLAIRPGPEWAKLVGLPLDEGIVRPSEKSSFFFAKAWTFVRERPGAYLGLLARKLYLFWRGDEIKRNLDPYFSRRYSVLLSILLWKRGLAFPFGLIAPLALVGMGLSLRHGRKYLLPLLFSIAYVTSVVLFFVTARYRMPVLPVLILFGAFALCRMGRYLEEREYRKLGPPALAALALLLASNLGMSPMHMEGDAETYYYLSQIYAEKGMYAKVTSQAREALRLDPDHVEARFNLGAAYAKLRRYDDAVVEYEKLLRIAPQRLVVQHNLANIYFEMGRLDEAAELYERLIRIRPDRAKYHYGLAGVYKRKDLEAEATAEYERTVQLDPRHVDAHYNLAFSYGAQGRHEDAIAEYERVIELGLDRMDVRNNLGITYMQLGNTERAIAQFERALELKPDYMPALQGLGASYAKERRYDEAISAYKRILEIDPERGDVHYDLARLYGRKGQEEIAKEEMKKYASYMRRWEIFEAVDQYAKKMLGQLRK